MINIMILLPIEQEKGPGTKKQNRDKKIKAYIRLKSNPIVQAWYK